MSCTPVLSQDGFIGRNDNGSETTATAKAAENGNWTQAVNTNFRIRLHIQVTNACAAANKTFQLQYSLDGGTYTTVNGSSSVVRSSASDNVADGATTTDQMTVGSGTFIGLTAFDEVDGLCGGSTLDIAASGHTEVEFCVQIRGADVTNGQTVQLRVSSTNLASWTQVPSITVYETTISEGAGSSTGAVTVTGAGQSTNLTVGSSIGAVTVSGVGQTIVQAAGSVTGTATVDGVGEDASGPTIVEGDGSSTGTVTVTAVSQAIAQAVGSSSGGSTVTATAQATAQAAGSSVGESTVAAIAQAFALGGGSSVGISTAEAIAQVINLAVGSSEGSATVLGVGADGAAGGFSAVQGMIHFRDSRRR